MIRVERTDARRFSSIAWWATRKVGFGDRMAFGRTRRSALRKLAKK